MKWVVAVACVDLESVFSQPADFLSNIAGRSQPNWAVGVVEADNENQAYLFGEIAFKEGKLVPNEPGRFMANWYVAPLLPDASIPSYVVVNSITSEQVARHFHCPIEFAERMVNENISENGRGNV